MNDIEELKQRIIQIESREHSRAWQPLVIVGLSVVAAVQAGLFLIAAWNLKRLDSQRVPYLEATIEAWQPLLTWDQWLWERRERFEKLLSAQEDQGNAKTP